jgi:pimeloyl-ACP methyl ester carboxylesterase
MQATSGIDVSGEHRQHVNICSQEVIMTAPALPRSEALPSPSFRLENRSPLMAAGRQGAAWAQLMLLAATGLTRLVASVHATIASRPALDGDSVDADQAPTAYNIVSESLLWLAALTHQSQPSPASQQGGLFRSAVNGVLGDTLSDLNSSLCQNMSLRDESGREITSADWQRNAHKGVVLFLHGLCLSEREWQGDAHANFVQELRASGYGVAWLRYNTGRAIYENGAGLSQLLEAAELDNLPLTLIGHSMGGLVMRAALHHAEQHDMHWPAQFRQGVYLGTPHQGAPLERLGEGANRLLGLTPYTRPLMQIGALRSQGIQDLRHGRISTSREQPFTLAPQARHLLIAAYLGNERTLDMVGDGLVPVSSALGQNAKPKKNLSGGDLQRRELPALSHVAMLKDERVYQALREWMHL